MAAADSVKILITAVDETKAAIASAKSGLSGLGDSATKLSGLMAAIGGSAVIAGIMSIAKASIDSADNLAKLAQKTGISTEKLSLLQPVAEQAGTSMEGLAKGLQKLATSMNDAAGGAKEPTAAFDRLGISVTDTTGKLRPTEEVLMDLADAFSAMPDGAEKSALAVKLFGKSGVELIPFLNQGRSGIGELTDQFKKLGLELDGTTAKSAEKFNDTLDTVGQAVKGMGNQIMTAALPAMQAIADAMVKVASHGDAIIKTAKLIGVGLFSALAVKGVQAALAMEVGIAGLIAMSKRFLPILIAMGAWEIGSSFFKLRAEIAAIDAQLDAFARRDAQVKQLNAAMQELATNGALSVATQLELAKQAAERMQAALPGVATALKAIGATATEVGVAIRTALDGEIKKAVDTVKTIGVSYKAVAADISGTRTAQLAEIEANYKRQEAAAKLSGASERDQIAQSGKALVAAETAKRTVIDESGKKMLEAWKKAYEGAVALAKKAGIDTAAIDKQSAQDKLGIYTQIETAYRATVDRLMAEENRLAGEIKKIQGDIVAMHQDTDTKIREIGRGLMTDEQARADKRLQLETLFAQAKAALAAGNFSEAQKYAQQAMALAVDTANGETAEYRKSREAMKESNKLRTEAEKKETLSREAFMRGENDLSNKLYAEARGLREDASVQDAKNQEGMRASRVKTGEATDKVRTAEQLLADAMKGTEAAMEEQRKSVAASATGAQDALKSISAAVDTLRADLLKADKLKLEFDLAAAQDSVTKIGAMVAAEQIVATITAETKAAADAVAQFQTDTSNKEFLANVVAKMEAAEKSIKDFKDTTEAAGVKIPAAMQFDTALSEVKTFRTDAVLILEAPTSAEHTPKPNMREFEDAVRRMTGTQTESRHTPIPDSGVVNAEFARLNSMVTHSTHYIHTVQGNAAGGLIQAFASGGQAFRRARGLLFGPGTGTSDSIPSMLSAGEFVIKAASVKKFGADFFAALNAGFMPPIPRYATGGLVAAASKVGAGNTAQNDTVDLRFHIGGQAHTVKSSRDTAMQLAVALRELSRGA